MALVLAQQEQCPLLTGDRYLRQAAEKEGVVVKGTLWLVEQLVIQGLMTADDARNSYQCMKDNGRRLPWDAALQRLNDLQEKT